MGVKLHTHITIFCITMLGLLVLGGCNPAPAGKSPQGWPIAELTLPDSAVIDMGERAHKTNSSGDEVWTVGINKSMGWDKLNQQVVSCLKPLGYSEYYNIKDGNDKRGNLRTYVSGDMLTEVSLWNLSAMGAPADKPSCTVSVIKRQSPSDDVLNAGKTVDGFEHVLKPL